MTMEAINPATGEVIKTYPTMTGQEVEQVIQSCHQAFHNWRNLSFAERSQPMKQAAQVLRDNVNEYAKLMAREMGKPINDGRAEVNKCALACDFYAENAAEYLKPEPVQTDASRSFVSFQPLGVVLAVMPWNFPFWQIFRFAAPGLMAGNTAVLKHASNVPGCALAIEDVFKKAGFPVNTFRSLMISNPEVAAVIENPKIMAVTLTGSTAAGKAVAAKAGQMLKKTVLELGGSDAYIVLADADLEETAAICAAGRLVNSGQSCIAAKRFIVVSSVREKFEELLIRQMKTYKVGDPLDDTVKVGPQARHDLRDGLHRQVKESIARGAKCLMGGEIPTGKGAFYPPSILTEVKKGMPAYDEEMFGPVAAIITVKDEAEAIQTANDSVFGLGAVIFTRDIAKGVRIAEKEIQAGSCFVNAFVRSDPRLPFGGIKESGYGRELSHYGIKEFVNIKTIYVK